MIRSPKGAAIWSLVLALPALLMRLDPVFFLWSLFLILYVLPWGMCTACMTGGMLPMLVGLAAGIASLYGAGGAAGAAVGALLLLPPATAFCVITVKEIRFQDAVKWMLFALVTGLCAALLLLRSQVPDGDLARAAGETASAWFTGMGDTGDMMLFEFEQFGMLQIPESLFSLARTASIPLPDELRNELLLQVRSAVGQYVNLLLPVQLAGVSLYSAVASVSMSQHYGRLSLLKRGAKEPFPALGMPHLRFWRIPRRWGLAFGLCGLGVLIELVTEAPAAVMVGDALYCVFSTVYTIQGIAVVNFLQHMRGSKRVWHYAVPVLLLLLLPLVPVLLGILDQARDPRGLRGAGKGAAGTGDTTGEEQNDGDDGDGGTLI